MLVNIRFGEFKYLVSGLDRLSICMKDSGMYENYRFISEVPEGKYDDYYVYGVGIIKSEFEIGPDGPDTIEKRNMINEKKCFMECMEIVLDKKPKKVGQAITG